MIHIFITDVSYTLLLLLLSGNNTVLKLARVNVLGIILLTNFRLRSFQFEQYFIHSFIYTEIKRSCMLFEIFCNLLIKLWTVISIRRIFYCICLYYFKVIKDIWRKFASSNIFWEKDYNNCCLHDKTPNCKGMILHTVKLPWSFNYFI